MRELTTLSGVHLAMFDDMDTAARRIWLVSRTLDPRKTAGQHIQVLAN